VTWDSAPPLSVGIEEELLLVDAETLDLLPAFEEVVGEPTPRIKPELFACLLEIATQPHETVEAALRELEDLRADVRRRAEAHGVTAIAGGTHPTASTAGQMILPYERYERIRAQLGEKLTTQVVCGVHVHVAMPDPDTALHAFEGVVPWLPTLLALSANSPFVEGRDTGFRSTRAERLLLLPTGGTPPLLPDWAAWEEATQGDDTRRHWDAWPRPEHGTLEVRVMDQQTDVRRSAGLAAIVRSLVAAVLERDVEPYDRELYARRRAEAARSAPVEAEVDALAGLVARDSLARYVLDGRPEAERQLELGPERALDAMAVASAR
jgi:glutamate---cysteine ligase / carboxylate-amine ligase